VFGAYAPVNKWLRETRDPDGPPFFFNTDFSDDPVEARNDHTYTIGQLLELAAVIEARLGERGLDVQPRPDAAGRASIISHVVSCFIALRAASP
jgi:hypothetical protein